MEYVVNAVHGIAHGADVAHIADIKLNLLGDFGHLCLKLVAHIVLLLFIARKDADLPDIRPEEPIQYGIAERPRPSGDKKCFVSEKCFVSHVFSPNCSHKFILLFYPFRNILLQTK